MLTLEIRGDCETIVDWINSHAKLKTRSTLHSNRHFLVQSACCVSIHNGDQKFLYRSVRAAFVNTKWYETWLEAQVCSRGCQASLVTVITQDTLVVPCLRCGSFPHHKSVGGRGCGRQRAY